MSFNKISGGIALYPEFQMALPAGEVAYIPTGQSNTGLFGQVNLPQLNVPMTTLTGQYQVDLGSYSVMQVWDVALNYWWNVESGGPLAQHICVSADGANYRIANSTGCPVGALITAKGSGGVAGFYGYVQGPGPAMQLGLPLGSAITIIGQQVAAGNTAFTITPSAGGSTWNAIVGGSVNTTISFSGTVFAATPSATSPFGGTGASAVASAGSNYTRTPIIVFFPPPNQGVQPYLLPTAICTISGGAINAVTVLNQGAGLVGLPGIAVINAPGDTTGGGAVLGWLVGNSADPNAGAVTAMWPAFYGTALTAVPTFTFAGTANPAPTVTAIMNFTITSFTATTPGVGYVAAGGAFQGGIVAGSSAITNPILDKGLNPYPLFPPVNVAATTGLPSLAGPFQGVNIQAVPTFSAFSTGAAASTAAVTTSNVGGASDIIQLFSF